MTLIRRNRWSLVTRATLTSSLLFLCFGNVRADVTLVAQTTVKTASSTTAQSKNDPPTTTITYYKNDKRRTEDEKTITIYDGAQNVTYTLNPAAKTYTESVGQLGGLLSKAKNLSSMREIQVDSRTVVNSGKQTRTIAGQKTKKYHYITIFTLDITPEVFTKESDEDKAKIRTVFPLTLTEDGEEWATEGLRTESAMNERRAGKELENFTLLFPEAGIAMQNYLKQMEIIKGVTLLTTRTTTFAFPDGARAALLAGLSADALPKGPTKTTVETKAISTARLDDALFVVPADYKKADAPAPTPDAAPELPKAL